MKRLLVMFSFALFSCFFIACGTLKNSSEKKPSDYSGITKLHKEMNERNGKTSSYYASIAIANENYDEAYSLYYTECKAGSITACLNAYYIGEERALEFYDSDKFVKDLDKSIKQSIDACEGGESLGCVNVFFAFDTLNNDDNFISDIISKGLKGQSNNQIMDKALKLTDKECKENDATSCFLNARMQRSIDIYANVDKLINKGLDLGYVLAPFVYLSTQSSQSIEFFKRACDLNEALSCRYVAYWLDKYERDFKKAKEYYKKACALKLEFACEEDRKKTDPTKTDEVGAPVLNRR